MRLGIHIAMTAPTPPIVQRRTVLRAALTAPIWATHLRPSHAAEAASVTVAQIVDMSGQSQDVSRDFVVGSRAAWAGLNAAGGLRGRPVQHRVLETDGSAAALRAAWETAHADTSCIALSGCVGDGAAAALAALRPPAAPLAQGAPWLHRLWEDTGDTDTVFPIFPNYQAQIRHSLRSLSVMGVQQAGVAFAHAQLQRQLLPSVATVAGALGLRMEPLSAGSRSSPPPIILFVGGTPELHDYVSRMVLAPGRQCYVIALADVNLQILAQMGGPPHNVSVIATQPVPLFTASLPIVRAYREVMARLYDEPPSPQGLAGFIAARYTAEVLMSVPGPLHRASVLAAFRRRTDMDLGGFVVAYEGKRLSNAHVTQSMLTADGRIVG